MRETPGVPLEEIHPQHEAEARGREYTAENESPLSQYILDHWRGDAHTHTQKSSRGNYPEGIYSEAEVMKYYEGLGLEFVAFTEHTSSPGSPHRVEDSDPIAQDFRQQIERIENLNREGRSSVAALASAEVNVYYEGDEAAIDLPDSILEKLDFVLGSRHSIVQEKDLEAIRTSLLKAVRHPRVDAIGHPDRYIKLDANVTKDNEPCPPEDYWQMWDEVLDTMVKEGKAFEINFNNQPDPALVELAAKKGVSFLVNYDAHEFNQYKAAIETGETAKKQWAADTASPEDLETLQQYKLVRMQSGPGVKELLRLVRQLKRFEELGVTTDRIVNSSRDRFLHFLIVERGHDTANLKILKERFQPGE